MGPRKKVVDVANAQIAARHSYTSTLQDIQTEGFCPFCDNNLTKHHKKPILRRNTHWIVTTNAWPYEGSRYHFLFISREHIDSIEKLSPATWADLQKQLTFLRKKYDFKGGSLIIRSGETKLTGASVTHLHGHFIVGSKRTLASSEIRAVIGFKK